MVSPASSSRGEFMSKITRIKGFADLFPPQSDGFTRLERTAAGVFRRYGYQELRTPILEKTELFKRSIGEDTDVVSKEMYTFEDRKNRSLTMRPEATAGVMRAYIESGLAQREPFSKLYTIGPMFRYERPQKGRMRQFHQINAECLGLDSPVVDAEVIAMLWDFLTALALPDLHLEMNNLGCPQCRPAYLEALKSYLDGLDDEGWCEDCLRRKASNPLRVLDCKVPGCQPRLEAAPALTETACPVCAEHFGVVCALLKAGDMPYTINKRLVRGLDYYCRTTFEVVSGSIGSQSAVAGGGRYDGLIKSLGGPDQPGVGFALGMERLMLLMEDVPERRPDFYIAVLDPAAQSRSFVLARELRDRGLTGELAPEVKSLKAQMRQANRLRAHHCILFGADELARDAVQVKRLETGEQHDQSIQAATDLDALAAALRQ